MKIIRSVSNALISDSLLPVSSKSICFFCSIVSNANWNSSPRFDDLLSNRRISLKSENVVSPTQNSFKTSPNNPPVRHHQFQCFLYPLAPASPRSLDRYAIHSNGGDRIILHQPSGSFSISAFNAHPGFRVGMRFVVVGSSKQNREKKRGRGELARNHLKYEKIHCSGLLATSRRCRCVIFYSLALNLLFGSHVLIPITVGFTNNEVLKIKPEDRRPYNSTPLENHYKRIFVLLNITML